MAMTHICVYTAKLDESIKFYQEVVGLEIVNDLRGKTPFNIVFMANSPDETKVELIESANPTDVTQGIAFGYPVDDVKAKYEEVKAMGLNPEDIVPNGRFFFVSDPNGVKIQFMIRG